MMEISIVFCTAALLLAVGGVVSIHCGNRAGALGVVAGVLFAVAALLALPI